MKKWVIVALASVLMVIPDPVPVIDEVIIGLGAFAAWRQAK